MQKHQLITPGSARCLVQSKQTPERAMSMITDARRRVNDHLRMIDEDRAAQSICLFSAILLFRYCTRGLVPFFPSPAPLLYSILVLSIMLIANYKYSIPTVKNFVETIKGSVKMIWQRLRTFRKRIYQPIDRAENLFLRMTNISGMVNQMIFLMLADRLLIAEPKMTSLYTLMFYNVITYCVNYIKELIEKEDWSPYVTLTERSKIKHLAMSATKIVLEWTKAVTFIVTITFMLLVFGLEQGLEHYKPSTIYTAITWMYYSATEQVFIQMFPFVLKVLQLEMFENLEDLYAPVILRSFTVAASTIFTLLLLPQASWTFLLFVVYLNVYLRSKELVENSGAALLRARDILNRYRKATLEEIQRFDDVCAVCLCSMTKARITPCHHLFHASCLHECLKTSDVCPMCKRELKFEH